MTTIQDAVPFPEDAAATVRKWANLFFYQPAIDTLDLVKDMIGHPDNVQRAVTAWETAATHMQESSRSIISSKAEVDGYWAGGAATAFATHITDAKKRAEDNASALQTAAKDTATLYSTLINMYKTCVNFILDCAKALSNFAGGALGDWKSYLGAAFEATGVGAPAGFALQASHFTGLLSDMVDNVKNVIDNAMDAHVEQVKALNNVSATVKSVSPPGEPGGSIRDPEAWTRL